MIGDSWFNYTMFNPYKYFRLVDTVDWLRNYDYDLCDCAIPGYTLNAEYKIKLYRSGLSCVDKTRPLVVLLSLGGNDLIDIFHRFVSGSGSKAKINRKELNKYIKNDLMYLLYKYLTSILTDYQGEITLPEMKHVKRIKIIMHGYDYFHPEKAPSSNHTAMLKNFFDEKEIPEKTADKIVRDFLNIINDQLKKMEKKTPVLEVIDLRGEIPKEYWDEQIHPSPEGYKIIASKFIHSINKAFKEIL